MLKLIPVNALPEYSIQVEEIILFSRAPGVRCVACGAASRSGGGGGRRRRARASVILLFGPDRSPPPLTPPTTMMLLSPASLLSTRHEPAHSQPQPSLSSACRVRSVCGGPASQLPGTSKGAAMPSTRGPPSDLHASLHAMNAAANPHGPRERACTAQHAPVDRERPTSLDDRHRLDHLGAEAGHVHHDLLPGDSARRHRNVDDLTVW